MPLDPLCVLVFHLVLQVHLMRKILDSLMVEIRIGICDLRATRCLLYLLRSLFLKHYSVQASSIAKLGLVNRSC